MYYGKYTRNTPEHTKRTKPRRRAAHRQNCNVNPFLHTELFSNILFSHIIQRTQLQKKTQQFKESTKSNKLSILEIRKTSNPTNNKKPTILRNGIVNKTTKIHPTQISNTIISVFFLSLLFVLFLSPCAHLIVRWHLLYALQQKSFGRCHMLQLTQIPDTISWIHCAQMSIEHDITFRFDTTVHTVRTVRDQ